MATSNVYLTFDESMFDIRSDGANSNNPSSDYGTNAKNAAGAIEVLDFSFGITQVVSEDEDGRQGVVERIERGDVEIEKAVDARSPKLFIFCCKAVMLSEAKLKIFGPRLDKPYLTYSMKGVRISKYEASGGSELATEKIGLRFSQMKVKFDNAGIGSARNGNGRTGTVEYTWNWTMDVPGATPVVPGFI